MCIRDSVIRLGRSKDKITSNSLTCKVQLMSCEIKQIRRILDKFKSIFPYKRVRFKTEKNLPFATALSVNPLYSLTLRFINTH